MTEDKTPTWDEVKKKDKFKSLSYADKERARKQYFDEVIAPKVPKDKIDEYRSAFDRDTVTKRSPKEMVQDFGSEVGRQVGLTARAGITGAMSIPNMVGDLIHAPLEALQGGSRIGSHQLTGPVINDTGIRPPSQALQNTLTAAGFPVPRNATERVVQAGASGVAGAGTQLQAVRTLADIGKDASALFEGMKQAPRTQLASGATGGVSGQTAAEMGGGPATVTLASLAGGALPSVPNAGARGVQRGLRGPESNLKETQSTIEQFKKAGTTPSVSQATGAKFPNLSEGAIAHLPGGYGALKSFGEKQQAQIGARAEQLADNISSRGGPFEAGRTIEQGISGEGGFISRFQEGQKSLYGKVDKLIKPDMPVNVSNTKKTLESLTKPTPGAERTSGVMVNPRIKEIKEALDADLTGASQSVTVGGVKMIIKDGKLAPLGSVQTGNTLPWEAMKELRTKVGSLLNGSEVMAKAPRDQLKALYASLTKDMEAAVTSTGNADAAHAWSRADRFTKAGHDRIDTVLQKVVNGKLPEKIFDSATTDMRSGGTKISAIMRSLTPAERDVVKSAFIRRMGQASERAQSAEGDVFSSNNFLTSWNKMSPQAKAVMFEGEGGKLRENLDSIAKASEKIRDAKKVNATASRWHDVATFGSVGSAITAVATGHPAVAAALLGEASLNYLGAKALTSPAVVDWLANSQKIETGALPSALNNLQQSMKDEDSETQKQVNDYVNAVRKETNLKKGKP